MSKKRCERKRWGVDHMRQDEEQNGFATLKKLKANHPVAYRGVDRLHRLDVLLVGKEREPECYRAGVSVEEAAYRDRSIFDRTGRSREPLRARPDQRPSEPGDFGAALQGR